MSQPNNNFPPFNFNVNQSFYDSQSQLSNASFPQWHSQGSRTIGNSVPSPSPSIRTARTAPNPGPNRVSFSQPNVDQRDNTIDSSLPNVSLLSVPTVPRPRSAIGDAGNADPIARFYNDAPWSSERRRNPSVALGRSYFSQPNMDYEYREGPGSEIESIAPRSDSGYYTHHPHSIISNDLDRGDQELPSDMTLQVGNMNVSSVSGEQTDIFRGERHGVFANGYPHEDALATSPNLPELTIPSPSVDQSQKLPALQNPYSSSQVVSTDQASQYSGRSTNQFKDFKCTHCKETYKCKSDHKKHMLKHDKPFRCGIPNCRRGGRGFTTINDLSRHKKSVHRIGALQNSYQCASENCRNKEKIWPRLDNFKQHIHRMHRDEDESDLIGRSAYQRQEQTPTTEPLSVAPMDTTLAGIGTETQFSGNEFDDPVSGISLTPDQDSNHWTSFDPSSHDFSMDVDQTNLNVYSHSQGSRRSNANSGYKLQGQSPIRESSTASRTAPRTKNLERLDTLAAIASSQSPDKPAPQPPQLSNAPQTKADQQRQALRKFSQIITQDIKNSSTAEPVDLENVVLRVLCGATKLGKKNRPSSHTTPGSSTDQNTTNNTEIYTLTKGEALKASQAISNLIKQSGKASHRHPSKGFTINMKTCEHCGVTLARSCDMRKHMKRHTKPYGCTYPKCHKRFGAKSDWKRHENSQHFQLESFRCQLPSPSSQIPCGELFYRAENFKAHLQSHHKMTLPEQLAHEVRMRRIGKNGQGQFWCGFCEKIMKLDKKRNAAWDERFDHIDNHFSREKRGIEEWLCVEAKKTKGEVLREVDREAFDEEEMEIYGVEETDNGPAESPEESQAASAHASRAEALIAGEAQTSGEGSRKRKAGAPAPPTPLPPQKRAMREVDRYCCVCQHGPWPSHTYLDCMSCNHRLCTSCTIVRGSIGMDANIM